MGDLRTTQGEKPPVPVREQKWHRSTMFVIIVQVALAVTLIGFFIKIPRYTLANG